MAALERSGAPAFEEVLARHGRAPLEAHAIEVLQVNVGKLCNQTCAPLPRGRRPRPPRGHEPRDGRAGRRAPAPGARDPHRSTSPAGRPELNPQFRFLVTEACALGRRVIDRCNLTVLLLPAQRDLLGFLREHRVEVIASLPSFRAAGTDAQRGDGRLRRRAIEALRLLNELGYGTRRRASRSISSTTRSAPSSPATRPRSSATTSASCSCATASSSTASSRSRTCRSAGSSSTSSGPGTCSGTWSCW